MVAFAKAGQETGSKYQENFYKGLLVNVQWTRLIIRDSNCFDLLSIQVFASQLSFKLLF